MTRLLPLLGFVLLASLFGFGIWWNAGHDPSAIPTPLLNKPAPAFALPVLGDPARTVTRAELLGKPYLLNVFASWCVECAVEHPLLEALAPRLGVRLIGYNYKDDAVDAQEWLAQRGNPYALIMTDRSGRTAIDFGIYAAPESFLIDARGVIRYKHIGPFTPRIIDNELKPAIAALQREAS